MTLPREVAPLVTALLAEIREALGDNLTGAYLCGSLALGGFDPRTSDVDILVVTERLLSDAEIAGLARVHTKTAPSYETPGRDYEVYYVDRATLRRFAPGQRHVKVGPDDPLGWQEHRPCWMIERWVVREHGVVLAGPDTKTLIDPVSADEMRWAAREEMRHRAENWRSGRWPAVDLEHRGSQAFEVETVCRALHTIETGSASSKQVAVEWALVKLPPPWHPLIEWAGQHRKELAIDADRVGETLAFLTWAEARQAIRAALPAGLPADVYPLVDDLFAGACQALGKNLIGFYLRGSLALGGFDDETSDVDILAVTEQPVSDVEFASLSALHDRVGWRQTIYNRHYEVSYVDRAALRRFGPGERRHPTVGADWEFGWAQHPDNFVLERWVVRERGIVLAGPDPNSLIDPISPDDLRQAIRNEFKRHMVWASVGEVPDWLATRHYQAFAIETICRGLYTLETGELPTKPQAITWALGALPEPWRALAGWARKHHADKMPDGAMIPEVLSFVRWAASTTEQV